MSAPMNPPADEQAREEFRRHAALQCLLEMLGNAGSQEDKVRAAVRYADMLVATLGGDS